MHWTKDLIFIKGHYDPQGKFVKSPRGINGHLMLYMASVLPVCELAQSGKIDTLQTSSLLALNSKILRQKVLQ